VKTTRPKPRSRGRQSAPSPSAGKDQRRLTSAATALHEEPVPYRVGQRVPPVSDQSPGAFSSGESGARRDACPTFIDLFCGIGGFRLAFERAGGRCVFSSDWDKFSRQTYAANFGETPHGDIHTVAVADIPKFDILCGGFPCQPFSLAGMFQTGTLSLIADRLISDK